MNKRELVECPTTGKWKNMPDDEPVFLLRAQDYLASEITEELALRARAMYVDIDKVNGAFDKSKEMLQWPTHKIPD